ncbi:stage II sporulation protein D [Alkaliphilus serpentinus]|uniref:Stage II sporulation protein D n=1 Tax=Alkaliphilus serpentinus TaxID=1482731 RepID=A0A833HLU2_9FIRM|nr:stage II sporulation protein D [Alkaliphilus serpentinus]KAB3526669.1 stage II sporulation protein D [Alkaliphilus serpentinus]
MRGFFYAILSLLATTLLIPIFIITSCEIKIPIIDKDNPPALVESDLLLKVYNHKTNKIMELDLEEYIANVVAAEVPASFHIEALKAQAVAARTYAVWKQDKENANHPGASLCTSHTHCQEWLSKDELRERHGRLWMYQNWPRVQEAVEATKGIIITYNLEPIEPLYHSTSGGKTENSEDVFASAVPYLRSVSSPYEDRSPVLADQKKVSSKEFINTLKNRRSHIKLQEKNLSNQIQIQERSSGGRITKIIVGNEEFTGRELREMFQLRSADFTVNVSGNTVIFHTKGYGHGVGMSQWGANGMAEEGYTYEEILTHYYQGVMLSQLKSYR